MFGIFHFALSEELEHHGLQVQLPRGSATLFDTGESHAAVLPPFIYLDGLFIALLSPRVDCPLDDLVTAANRLRQTATVIWMSHQIPSRQNRSDCCTSWAGIKRGLPTTHVS